MVVGILTEKPSAARHFAAALGGMSGTYDGERFVIAHARGHLYEFVDPHRMVPDAELVEKYRVWDLANLPWDPDDLDWRLEVIKGASTVAREVKRVLGTCEEIVIATDVDPTGEGGMIAVNALLELGLTPVKWSRMYFTDEAAASLRKAFTSRKAIAALLDFDEYKKARYRSQFDLLSMQFTRVATNMARQCGRDVVLRQGRLKSAMVKLVGDQMKAHNDYVKRPFFQNRFRDENGVMYTSAVEPRFDRSEQVPNLYGSSPVVLDSKARKQAVPPRLLDLAALSSILVGAGIKAQLVLSTYQKMYEAQVVSYPRTEDKTITPEQFNQLAPLADQIASAVSVETRLLTHREPRKTHVKAQGAHGANRPGPKVPASLDEVEQRFGKAGRLIYATLARNYLAILAPDYRYEQHKGHLARYPEFIGIANVPLSAGWKAVFDPDDEPAGNHPADDPAGDDPSKSEGDSGAGEAEGAANESAQGLGTRAEPFVFEGANKRPEHPSMKWLMKHLERREVGTGATRTSTYAEVTSTRTKYPLLVEKGRKLTLAAAGDLSWRLLPGTRISDLALTEKVYADMRNIAAGEASAEERLAVVADWVREDIDTMRHNAAVMRSELGVKETVLASTVPKEQAQGIWSRTGKPVGFAREWGGHRFDDQEVASLLAGEVIEFSATSSAGNAYEVSGELAEGTYKGRTFVGFHKLGFGPRGTGSTGSAGSTGGEAVPPQAWCQHVFTPEEVDRLVAGEGVEASDFVSKKGNRFQAKVFFREEKGQSKKIVPDFEAAPEAPPKSWCGVAFTEDQLAALAAGKTIQGKGFKSKKGKKFDAALTWKNEDGKKKLVASFG